MKTILMQGAFDILNAGHVQAFKLCKNHADYLIVALNTDELLLRYKKRVAVVPFDQKKLILESIKYVDKVVPCETFSMLPLLQQYKPNIFAYSVEYQKPDEEAYMQSIGGTIIMLPRFAGVITTGMVKYRLLLEASENPELYNFQVETLEQKQAHYNHKD